MVIKLKRGKNLISNVLLSGVVSVLMRYIGLRFNVYLNDSVGALGMGVYTLILSVGGFAITLALSGVGIGSTRLCSDAYAKNEYGKVRACVRVCVMYALFFGFLSAVLLFFCAEPISVKILKNQTCTEPLKVFAFCTPFMAVSSAIGGYFLSCGRIYKSLISGICQQFISIGTTVCFANYCNFSENPAFYIIFGSLIGEISGLIILLLFYILEVKTHLSNSISKEKGRLRELCSISLPIAFSAYVKSILVSVEHILIPRGLARFSGDTETALADYGTLHAMAMPIILFPMVIISALAGLLIPEMSARNSLGDGYGVNRISSKVYRLTLAYSIGCSGIMLLCSDMFGEVIYNSSGAGEYIRYVAPLIPVMYLDHVTDGMLKGLGEQLYCMKVNIADAGISVILVFFIVPYYGTIGYIFVVYAMEIFNSTLSIARLLKICDFRIDFKNWLIKPLLCACITGILCKAFMPSLFRKGGFGVALIVIIGGLIYLFCLFLFGVLSEKGLAGLGLSKLNK